VPAGHPRVDPDIELRPGDNERFRQAAHAPSLSALGFGR
jgi:hypothetical protein